MFVMVCLFVCLFARDYDQLLRAIESKQLEFDALEGRVRISVMDDRYWGWSWEVWLLMVVWVWGGGKVDFA